MTEYLVTVQGVYLGTMVVSDFIALLPEATTLSDCIDRARIDFAKIMEVTQVQCSLREQHE